jgi:hypothetical protein
MNNIIQIFFLYKNYQDLIEKIKIEESRETSVFLYWYFKHFDKDTDISYSIVNNNWADYYYENKAGGVQSTICCSVLLPATTSFVLRWLASLLLTIATRVAGLDRSFMFHSSEQSLPLFVKKNFHCNRIWFLFFIAFRHAGTDGGRRRARIVSCQPDQSIPARN